jgi:hypothetical protein
MKFERIINQQIALSSLCKPRNFFDGKAATARSRTG